MITRIIRGNATYDDYQLFHATERIYLIPRGISPLYPIDGMPIYRYIIILIYKSNVYIYLFSARNQRFRVYTENLWALPVPNVGNGYFSLSTPTVYT